MILITGTGAGNIYDDLTPKLVPLLKAGDAQGMTVHFNDMIELTLPGDNGRYSKVQATQILKKFFTQYPVKDFKVTRKGDATDGSYYYIGTLSTNRKDFILYILTRRAGNAELIFQFKIEE